MRSIVKLILVIVLLGGTAFGSFLAARHARPGKSSSGDMLEYHVYNALSGEAKNIYTRFSRAGYTFEPGDRIEYDVRLPEQVAGAGGIEVLTGEDQGFRDEEDWVDQNGVSG